MKVFLSGKMDEYGSWRDAIIGKVYDHDRKRSMPRWEIVRGMTRYYRSVEANEDAPAPWPQDPNRLVLGIHDYVGPYRVTWNASIDDEDASNLGYFHGSTWSGCHGQMDHADQQAIVRECMSAISRADLVFAYLNRPDCFGTLSEIGIAASLGKFVYVLVDDEAEWEWSDYWFAGALPGVHMTGGPYREGRPADHAFIVDQFKEALVQWTARPEKPAPVALAIPSGAGAIAREAANSFAQIAHWSADPRVRTEAQRMLRRITG